jgi:hypothetical protein
MKTLIKLFSAVLTLGAICHGAVLIVHADAECRLIVDGKPRGTLVPNKAIRLKLAAGDHRLEASPSVGGSKWLQLIALNSSKSQQELAINLTADRGYWIDSSSGLMWLSSDNGSGLSWHQAIRYCEELRVAGFKDWELPAIDHLQSIFNTAPSNDGGFHVRGPLKLTGWQWSATPGQQPGEGWAFDFGDGGRASVAAGDSGLNRAICVRRLQN